jgi:hypothetical protein
MLRYHYSPLNHHKYSRFGYNSGREIGEESSLGGEEKQEVGDTVYDNGQSTTSGLHGISPYTLRRQLEHNNGDGLTFFSQPGL